MVILFKCLNDKREIVADQLDAGIASQLLPLEGEVGDYFVIDAETVMLDVSVLVNTRARTKGIVNANRFMREAAKGQIERRAPISVAPLSDGYWEVLDGNSTVLNAILAGWGKLPCKVSKS